MLRPLTWFDSRGFICQVPTRWFANHEVPNTRYEKGIKQVEFLPAMKILDPLPLLLPRPWLSCVGFVVGDAVVMYLSSDKQKINCVKSGQIEHRIGYRRTWQRSCHKQYSYIRSHATHIVIHTTCCSQSTSQNCHTCSILPFMQIWYQCTFS